MAQAGQPLIPLHSFLCHCSGPLHAQSGQAAWTRALLAKTASARTKQAYGDLSG